MGWFTRSDSTSTSSGSTSSRSKNATKAYDWEKNDGGYIPYRHQAEHRKRWRQEDHNERAEERREWREKHDERYVPVNEKKASFKAQIDAHKEQSRNGR